ncbi:MAG: ABC transporter permease subunit [Eubacteriales bacterium]|nr:ABC transporter permease subunit [Eubacteriales bacterium]
MKTKKKNTLPYHLMLLPGVIFLLVFSIAPMFGVIIAFQDFIPTMGIKGSEWVGLDNFKYMFQLPDTWLIFRNTLVIAVGKMVLTLAASIFFAILLNELRLVKVKKVVQTVAYLPHFLSWVILATIFRDMLDANGIINQILTGLGILKEPVVFLGSNVTFQPVMILSDAWKEFGYGAVIFIAALAGINTELYEAAEMDGAGRLRKIWHITLPGIRQTIVLVATLNIAGVLNAGFDQIYNLYSPIVYRTGDVIDTYVYRMGFMNAQFSLATAVGLMKSAVSFLLIFASYKLADKFANYRIF